MNRACPTCGLDYSNNYVDEFIPFAESMREENTIGGLWFCSVDCRDEYRSAKAEKTEGGSDAR